MRSILNEVAQFERDTLEERQTALRALLRHPLLLADHPEHREDFAMVRRNGETLRLWFQRHTGWVLEVGSECARLYKVPARMTDPTHPARLPGKDEPAFTRRRYVLMCLALATLVRSESQTTLGSIASIIIAMWKEEPAFESLTFDLEALDSRRDLVAALRLLIEFRALTLVDGDDERFLRDRGQDVLYDVHHLILYKLLATRRSASSIANPEWLSRLESLVAEPEVNEGDRRNQRIRHHLNRRLLDDPILYVSENELGREAMDYLSKQRPHLIRDLIEATGLEAENRLGGIALADPSGDCTDIGLPDEGTDGHATLLTAEYLGKLRTEQPGDIVSTSVIERFIAERAAENKGFWRKNATVAGAEVGMAKEVLRRLASLDLVRLLNDGIVVMPAIHRYRHELKISPGSARHIKA